METKNGTRSASADRDRIFIDRNKTYLKGNLHTHTRYSDGKFSLEDTLALYRSRGYDFLAVTDHYDFVKPEDREAFREFRYDGHGIVLIHGIEYPCVYNGNDPTKGDYAHFNCFLPKTDAPVEPCRRAYADMKELQDCIDFLKERFALVQFNHPLFPRLTDEEMLSLHNFDLIEVYNHKDHREETGLDSAEARVWTMLNKGRRFLLSAGDDFHGKPAQSVDTCIGGFVMLCAEKSEEAILRALAAGDFYSSTGPQIVDFRLTGATLSVETSPVKSIVFFSNLRRRTVRENEDGSLVESASYTLTGKETYLWVKAVDRFGKVAWTQPIYF